MDIQQLVVGNPCSLLEDWLRKASPGPFGNLPAAVAEDIQMVERDNLIVVQDNPIAVLDNSAVAACYLLVAELGNHLVVVEPSSHWAMVPEKQCLVAALDNRQGLDNLHLAVPVVEWAFRCLILDTAAVPN